MAKKKNGDDRLEEIRAKVFLPTICDCTNGTCEDCRSLRADQDLIIAQLPVLFIAEWRSTDTAASMAKLLILPKDVDALAVARGIRFAQMAEIGALANMRLWMVRGLMDKACVVFHEVLNLEDCSTGIMDPLSSSVPIVAFARSLLQDGAALRRAMAAKDVESAALSGFRLGVYCSRIDRELVRPAWQRGLRSIRGASKGGHNRWAHESEDQKQKREQLRGKVREHVFKLLSQRNPPTRTSAIAAAARRFRISPSRARTWSQDIPYRVAIRCVLKSLVEKKYLQSDPLKDLPVDAWNALRDHPQNIAQ